MTPRILSAAALAALGLSCAQAAESVGPASLDLGAGASGCVLQWRLGDRSGETELGLPAPCRIHRRTDGTTRILELRGRSHVLVESSVPDPENPRLCRTQIKAVAVTRDGVRVAPRVSKVAACPPFQWEPQMFTAPFD